MEVISRGVFADEAVSDAFVAANSRKAKLTESFAPPLCPFLRPTGDIPFDANPIDLETTKISMS